MEPTESRLATINEAAAYLGVSPRTIRRRVHDGTITGYRFGPRAVRIDLDELDAALRQKIVGNVGIHSPATVFAEIGANIADGLAQGFSDKSPETSTAVSRLVEAASRGQLSAAGKAAQDQTLQKQLDLLNSSVEDLQAKFKNIDRKIIRDLWAAQRAGTPIAITREGRPITNKPDDDGLAGVGAKR